MGRPLIFEAGDDGPLGTQRRRLWVTLLPSFRYDLWREVFSGLLPATASSECPSNPAIGAGTAAGDAGELPGRQPLLVVVDHKFGMLLAADEEAG